MLPLPTPLFGAIPYPTVSIDLVSCRKTLIFPVD